jgi:RNA polymerase sigma factor (sigma-70 family)
MDRALESESVTQWFQRLRAGDDAAATLLWHRYFPRLVQLAQWRFSADRDPAYGADDAALSVFHLLCRGAKEGRSANVAGRDDLWRLLVTATRRKIIDQVRRSETAKRGAGLATLPIDSDVVAPEPTPETIAIMNEQLEFLLSSLRDDTLRLITLRRLEGFSNAEIATELDISERTVERKLNLIRGDWQKQV